MYVLPFFSLRYLFFPFPSFSTPATRPPPLSPAALSSRYFPPALPSGREKSRSHDFGKEESSMRLIGYVVIEISPKFPISIAFLRIWKHPSWQRTILLGKELRVLILILGIFPRRGTAARRIVATMSISFYAMMLLRGDSIVRHVCWR